MKIAIASDHAGYKMKESIIALITEMGHEITDFGASSEGSMDYPDTGFPAAESVSNGTNDLGVLICGSGIGMSIVANKVKGIRAALCQTEEIAKLAKEHNNANVLVLSGRFTDTQTNRAIVTMWLNTPFSNEERHNKRINKIKDYENNNK